MRRSNGSARPAPLPALACSACASRSRPMRAGYLVDRFFAAHVAAVLFLAPIAGFALLATASGGLPALGVTLVGLGLGTEIDLIAFLTSRYFGQRSFGQIYGLCFMLFG